MRRRLHDHDRPRPRLHRVHVRHLRRSRHAGTRGCRYGAAGHAVRHHRGCRFRARTVHRHRERGQHCRNRHGGGPRPGCAVRPDGAGSAEAARQDAAPADEEARMTAPFPTHKQEEWRYADLDALRPVWQQFAEPLTLTVGPRETFEKIWLPSDDPVQVRRIQIALEKGSNARLFALNTAAEYGRIEIEVSLAEGANFELYSANIGTGVSTNEIVTKVKHIGI